MLWLIFAAVILQCEKPFHHWSDALESSYQHFPLYALSFALSVPFCRTKWFHRRQKIDFFHLSVWLIGQGDWKFCWTSALDSGLIPDSLQLRQKSGLGQKVGNFWIFLTWYFNPILKQIDKMAILIHLGVLAKDMQWDRFWAKYLRLHVPWWQLMSI